MLEEIDREMDKRSLEGLLLICDDTAHNPEFRYLVRTTIPRGGIYFKKIGEKPLLLVSDIDLGNARRSIVSNIRTYMDYQYHTLLARYSPETARVALLRRIFKDYGVSGKILLSGRSESGKILNLVEKMRKYGYKIGGEKSPTLLESLMATKSRKEIEEISQLGKVVEGIMKDVIDMLANSKRRGTILEHEGETLTVGKIKQKTRILLSRNELLTQEDFIFSIGPSSSDPHNLGDDDAVVRIGQPIIFDLYPSDRSGHCFDTTRTFIIGKPGSKIKRMYMTVLESQEQALAHARQGERVSHLMNVVCDLMQKKGYKTIRDLVHGDPTARHKGFIHSLGHGVGWTLNDKPSLTLQSKDQLEWGNVFTVEPGLYDPQIGGVRLEDVVAMVDGEVRNLSSLRKDLTLK